MASRQRSRALLKLARDQRPFGITRIVPPSYLVRRHHIGRPNSALYHPPLQLPSNQRSLSTQSLPYIVQPSFWRSILPRSLRSKADTDEIVPKPKKKEWNPATFFIAIFMLIGSQAIQMISMRRDFDKFSNQTEARLAVLREVVRKIQNGENVDVEGLLGTGNKQAERDWEEVIRELEEEDSLYRRRRNKSKKPAQKDDESDNSPAKS